MLRQTPIGYEVVAPRIPGSVMRPGYHHEPSYRRKQGDRRMLSIQDVQSKCDDLHNKWVTAMLIKGLRSPAEPYLMCIRTVASIEAALIQAAEQELSLEQMQPFLIGYYNILTHLQAQLPALLALIPSKESEPNG